MPKRRWPPSDGDRNQARKAATATARRTIRALKAAGPCIPTKAEAFALLDGLEAEGKCDRRLIDALRRYFSQNP